MDQVKIGKFIQQMRKEHQLTQLQLAEALHISNKTVSKWETGNGLPDISLMMPLCETLGISVNELLSGEKLTESEYKQQAEEHLIDLVKEKEENKTKLFLAGIITAVSILAGSTLIVVSDYFELSPLFQILLLAIGLIVIANGVTVAAILEINAGTYECACCGKRFLPSPTDYFFSVHTPKTRRLRCPECGKKSFCHKRLTH